MSRRTGPLLLAILLLVPAATVQAAPPEQREPITGPRTGGPPLDATGRYIVVLEEGQDAKAASDLHARRDGILAERLIQRAFRGYTSQLTADQVTALRADATVAAVVPDEVIELAAQEVPTGVARIGGQSSTVADIDGVDQRVDADVAIVDTGIDPTHPDLNVAGGVDCSTTDRSRWRDVQGHGTHVAGTVGALDNGSGVVGVAPGVRLWAVKILNDDGYGYLSWYACGLDWIAAQRDPADASRPLIEAVNMSVTKWGKDDRNCGHSSNDILHMAICRVTSAGITVVAAAANDSGSAAVRVPAAYDEVITVSALADTDGRAGGYGGWRCGAADADDTFANFSNYGSDVDLLAPGKCIWSTLPGNDYGYSSGTSMAAPAVTGAVALYKSTRPWALPGAIKGALQLLGTSNWFTSTDPDSTHERLLNVARLGAAGDFAVKLSMPAGAEAGAPVRIPITISRTSTHFEKLQLSARTPDGFAVSLDRSSVSGFTGTSATVTVQVPVGTPDGKYPVTVRAHEGSRYREATGDIVVRHDNPTAKPPVAAPAYRYALTGDSAPLRVVWPRATDPSSTIAGYEVQHSVDGGAWQPAAAVSGSTTRAYVQAAMGHSHRFQVRARDAAGNWSAWVAGPAVRQGVVDSRSSSFRYTSSWRHVQTSWAYQQGLARTLTTGGRATLSVTGRTLAIVAPVGPSQGWADVYVSGVHHGRVNFWSSIPASRRVLWVRTFSTDATRTIELRAVVGGTRYRVDIDAILVGR